MDGNSTPSTPKVFWGPVTGEEIKEILLHQNPSKIVRRATISTSEPTKPIYPQSIMADEDGFSDESSLNSRSLTSEYLTANDTCPSKEGPTPSIKTALPIHQNDSNNSLGEENSSYTFSFPGIIPETKTHNDELNKELLSSPSTANTSYKSCIKETDNSFRSSMHNMPVSVSSFEYLNTNETYKRNIEDTSNISNSSSNMDSTEASASSNKNILTKTQLPAKLYSPGAMANFSFDDAFHYMNESTKSGIIRKINEGEFDTISISSDDDEEDLINGHDFYGNYGLELSNHMQKYTKEETYTISDNSSFGDSPIKEQLKQMTLQSSPKLCEESRTKTDDSLSGINSKSNSNELSNLEFNDTLEEMEMALKNGLDYTMPEETIDLYKIESELKDGHKLRCLEGSKSLQSKKVIRQTPTKTLIPIKYYSSKAILEHVISSKTPMKSDIEFKKPTTNSNCRTPYKNIVSPVAFYIKNSGKTPQIQHITTKSSSTSIPKLKITVSKKNGMDLPTHIYKLPKQVVTSTEKEVKLPGNIKKHIQPSVGVIAHAGRLAEKNDGQMSMEQQLLNEDITVTFNNESSVSLREISVHVAKNAYIK